MDWKKLVKLLSATATATATAISFTYYGKTKLKGFKKLKDAREFIENWGLGDNDKQSF